MSDLIRAELLKMRTTRMSWWIAAAALGFVPLSIALAIQAAGQAGNATLFADTSQGDLLPVWVGALVFAGYGFAFASPAPAWRRDISEKG